MNRYYHNEDLNPGGLDFKREEVSILDFHGRKVLAVNKLLPEKFYQSSNLGYGESGISTWVRTDCPLIIIVPGYVIGEPRKMVEGKNLPVTDVELVAHPDESHPDERRELTDLVRAHFHCPDKIVNFWP